MTANNPIPSAGSLDADSEPSELPEDPDDLELREEFSKELLASVEAVAVGSPTRSVGDVAHGLGLSW